MAHATPRRQAPRRIKRKQAWTTAHTRSVARNRPPRKVCAGRNYVRGNASARKHALIPRTAHVPRITCERLHRAHCDRDVRDSRGKRLIPSVAHAVQGAKPMRIAVLVESKTFTARTVRGGYVRCGVCPVCRTQLVVEVPDRDDDAVCDACGAIVGRVVLHARVDDAGVVRFDAERERDEDAGTHTASRAG